ncbi:MAG: hypothetical protein ACJAVK_002705, partial [Akkermansiaceae bacterium]
LQRYRRKNDFSAEQPATLKKLVRITKTSHQPIKPSVIYDAELTGKDSSQVLHQRTQPKKKVAWLREI